MAGDAFQKLKSSVNRGVATISVKTSSSLEKVKIKTHIESLNSDIQRSISHIGELAYSIWEAGDKDFSALEEQLMAIKQKKDEIQRLNEEYSSIDERDNQILGTAVQEDTPPPLEPHAAEAVCPNCGAGFAAGAKFCRKCGHKLEQ